MMLMHDSAVSDNKYLVGSFPRFTKPLSRLSVSSINTFHDTLVRVAHTMGKSVLPVFVIDILANLELAPTPVHFFSHGSTMMLGEESTSATYWKQCGDNALAHGIKGVVMMVGPTYDH